MKNKHKYIHPCFDEWDRLQQFCQDVLDALKDPTKGAEWNFWAITGLCHSWENWQIARGDFRGNNIFTAVYPFNGGGDKEYFMEKQNNRVYKNRKRMAFLRKYSKKVVDNATL
jgi:hypothetical protein